MKLDNFRGSVFKSNFLCQVFIEVMESGANSLWPLPRKRGGPFNETLADVSPLLLSIKLMQENSTHESFLKGSKWSLRYAHNS